jgi:hypothetical protein
MMVEVCQMDVRWCMMVYDGRNVSDGCQMVYDGRSVSDGCQMVYDGVGWLYREGLSDGEDGMQMCMMVAGCHSVEDACITLLYFIITYIHFSQL